MCTNYYIELVKHIFDLSEIRASWEALIHVRFATALSTYYEVTIKATNSNINKYESIIATPQVSSLSKF